ncbi:hypothetical protein ACVW0Y_000570 [Pseudomonas sp. TE3786]
MLKRSTLFVRHAILDSRLRGNDGVFGPLPVLLQ